MGRPSFLLILTGTIDLGLVGNKFPTNQVGEIGDKPRLTSNQQDRYDYRVNLDKKPYRPRYYYIPLFHCRCPYRFTLIKNYIIIYNGGVYITLFSFVFILPYGTGEFSDKIPHKKVTTQVNHTELLLLLA